MNNRAVQVFGGVSKLAGTSKTMDSVADDSCTGKRNLKTPINIVIKEKSELEDLDLQALEDFTQCTQ